MKRHRKHKVKIIYKSGAVQVIKCNELKISRTGSTLTSVEWKDAIPEPLLFGVDEVAAIYQLR